MISKPLEYESLKCVLQYMEVNKRLLISNKCPTTRTAERVVPLKIHRLFYVPNQITLNSTTYKIGIYQHYYVGQAPPAIERYNEEGGVGHEVDKFGIEVEDDKFVVMPGDIDMGRARVIGGIVRTDVEVIQQLGETIQIKENQLRRTPDPMLADALERDRDMLIAYHYRRCNLDPSYKHFIQITVGSEGTKRIERYVHNKKYCEAMKQLTGFMFAGRRGSPYVDYFTFNELHTIRFPVGAQFKFGAIGPSSPIGAQLEALKPIIHESSFPLKHLIVGRLTVAELTHPIVREAVNLIIHNRHVTAPTLDLLMNATNQHVRLASAETVLSSNNMLVLVQDWVQTGRPIGTRFTFSFEYFRVQQMRLRMICDRFNVELVENRHCIIPMAGAKQLKVYCRKWISQDNSPVQQLTWNIHIEVEAVEQK